MEEKDIYEKILNKKFLKSVFTGYDTTDVDRFFDFVIEYLKNNEKKVADYKKISDDCKAEVDKLKNNIVAKDKEIAKLLEIIKQYKEDGYDYLTNTSNKTQVTNDKKGAK